MPSKTEPTPAQADLGFQGAGFNWDEYISYRPVYPSSVWQRIYDVHSKHLNEWGVVNDIGAGAGIASEVLAKRFKTVVVSEPNVDYLKVAEARLSSLGIFPPDKFTFLPEGCEKSSLADSSVDCITICEALHWSHMETSMTEFARVLKPGGTLSVVHYSSMRLLDPEVDRLAQDLWTDQFLKTAHLELNVPSNIRVFGNLNNGYQNLRFDPSIWEAGVRRIYTNTKGDPKSVAPRSRNPTVLKRIEEIIGTRPPMAPNLVGPTDVEEFIEGDKDWMKEFSAQDVYNSFKTMYLRKDPTIFENGMQKLRQAMGDRKIMGYYPAVQIIASKKGNAQG